MIEQRGSRSGQSHSVSDLPARGPGYERAAGGAAMQAMRPTGEGVVGVEWVKEVDGG